ncbi:hypothetical protein COCMIDRAFT_98060 [Bipolaris oryzae ATCC 44560]|uniref:Methyltransferase domain-containing protein n=1 Tax=Bipolaris oryzae ATCC 44560 TaxID=930090 RepID=W6Z3E4_COCMI|nr:uncharacterized protein COCMIDRAFT_98060 [Bipolaris oryzae ATCC 44560]EUC44490.1 hypothetical protein COCMIDRAFT_98060 [Bipolaris oryzae ATCC 44560]
MTEKTLVEKWYDAHAEAEEHRLDEGRLEFEVTKRITNSCLSTLGLHRANILDVGGGPGRYAIALATQGHLVTLNDLSEKSLAIARKNAEKQNVNLNAIIHANALDITQHPLLKTSHASFDIVLCLGPLYHLIAPTDRAHVIQNCIDMAKPGGYILLAYVTIYAHLRDLATREPARLALEWQFYSEYLQTGAYTRNPATSSFHVQPADLMEEFVAFREQVGVERVVGCEGFLGAGGAKGVVGLDEEGVRRWVDVVMMSAERKEMVGCADHLVVVLRKGM